VLAHLGLGSNLGDRWAHLGRAVGRLRDLDPDLAVSPVYETAPVGGPAGQGPYLNCVVRLRTERSPRELLRVAQELEAMEGRVRAERWGPRTLDVDVLLLDALVLDSPELTVPHPRMWGRAFVLAPLEDLEPDRVPSTWRERLGGAAVVDRLVRRVGIILPG
jgi:2-amino-4-hydroxy-6-hydroxymethyldihydropteridine diphosphokinase